MTVRKGRWDFRVWGFGHFLIGVLAFAFKNWGFSVLVSCGGLRVFSNLLFGFRQVFVNGFSDFSTQCILRFFWFCQGGTPRSRAETVLTVRGMHDKPTMVWTSLFSSRHLGHNGCQADYGKPKIASKQIIISQISRGWDNIL